MAEVNKGPSPVRFTALGYGSPQSNWRRSVKRLRMKVCPQRKGANNLHESGARASAASPSEDLKAPLLGGGVEGGTEYDLSTGCPHCGTGSVQTSALFVPKSAVRQTTGLRNTVFGDTVLSSRIADVVEREGIAGIRLGDVVSARTNDMLSIRQLFATDELPPWSRNQRRHARRQGMRGGRPRGSFRQLGESAAHLVRRVAGASRRTTSRDAHVGAFRLLVGEQATPPRGLGCRVRATADGRCLKASECPPRSPTADLQAASAHPVRSLPSPRSPHRDCGIGLGRGIPVATILI
jgi:hypothetical protein